DGILVTFPARLCVVNGSESVADLVNLSKDRFVLQESARHRIHTICRRFTLEDEVVSDVVKAICLSLLNKRLLATQVCSFRSWRRGDGRRIVFRTERESGGVILGHAFEIDIRRARYEFGVFG